MELHRALLSKHWTSKTSKERFYRPWKTLKWQNEQVRLNSTKVKKKSDPNHDGQILLFLAIFIKKNIYYIVWEYMQEEHPYHLSEV